MKQLIVLVITLMLFSNFSLAEGVDPVQTFSEDNRLIQEDYMTAGTVPTALT